MLLINRLSQLFKADANAILDRIEDPEQLLIQAIREMQDSLNSQDYELKLLKHEQEQLMANVADIKQAFVQLDDELEVCLTSQKHDLARVVIRKKLLAEKILKQNTARLTSLKMKVQSREKAMLENQDNLQLMQQKADILISQQGSIQPNAVVDPMTQDLVVRDEDVEVALLKAISVGVHHEKNDVQ